MIRPPLSEPFVILRTFGTKEFDRLQYHPILARIRRLNGDQIAFGLIPPTIGILCCAGSVLEGANSTHCRRSTIRPETLQSFALDLLPGLARTFLALQGLPPPAFQSATISPPRRADFIASSAAVLIVSMVNFSALASC